METKRTLSDEAHNLEVRSTDKGFQAECSCGWKGPDHCRMSDDYAWTNSSTDGLQHKRMAQRLAGRPCKPIDIEDIGAPHLREDV